MNHAFSPTSAPVYIFQASIFSSLTWRSISSNSFLPRLGRNRPCDRTRCEPARSLTYLRVATIWSGGSGFLSQSRLGTPLITAMIVSLSPKTSLT